MATTRPVQLGEASGAAAPTFDQPFEMLQACHERLDRTLALLARLRAHVAANGADEQARQAARDVLRYFDQAAPQHHRDEELHVFPPLLAQADASTVAVVRRLQQDHAAMEVHWEAARQILHALAEGERNAFDAPADAALDTFAGLYAEHIQAEETIAYPAATQLLDASTVAAMGQEMRARRGAR